MAPWRGEAEAIVSDAVTLVWGELVNVTWYMAQCVIYMDKAYLFNVAQYVCVPCVMLCACMRN